jgi:hypothetical protein
MFYDRHKHSERKEREETGRGMFWAPAAAVLTVLVSLLCVRAFASQ